MFYVGLPSKNFTLLLIMGCLNGFFILGVFSIAFEMAVHVAKPYNVGEATNCSFINAMSNFVGFILVLGLTPLLSQREINDVFITTIILLVILAISFVLILLS